MRRQFFSCATNRKEDGKRGIHLTAMQDALEPCPPSLVYAFPARDVLCVVVFPGVSGKGLDHYEANDSFNQTILHMLGKALTELGIEPRRHKGQ